MEKQQKRNRTTNKEMADEIQGLRLLIEEQTRKLTILSSSGTGEETRKLYEEVGRLRNENLALTWWKDSICHEIESLERFLPEMALRRLRAAMLVMEKQA